MNYPIYVPQPTMSINWMIVENMLIQHVDIETTSWLTFPYCHDVWNYNDNEGNVQEGAAWRSPQLLSLLMTSYCMDTPIVSKPWKFIWTKIKIWQWYFIGNTIESSACFNYAMFFLWLVYAESLFSALWYERCHCLWLPSAEGCVSGWKFVNTDDLFSTAITFPSILFFSSFNLTFWEIYIREFLTLYAEASWWNVEKPIAGWPLNWPLL